MDYLISLYQKKMDEGAFVKQKELDAVSNRLKELDQIIKRLYEDSALGSVICPVCPRWSRCGTTSTVCRIWSLSARMRWHSFLSSNEITARTFGAYISVYDFKRAVEDKLLPCICISILIYSN